MSQTNISTEERASTERSGSREQCELTILMPCLNEAETLSRCIAKARGFLDRAGIDGEVLIADNGSTDGSQAIAVAEGARVVPIAERGYGSALRGGIHAALTLAAHQGRDGCRDSGGKAVDLANRAHHRASAAQRDAVRGMHPSR